MPSPIPDATKALVKRDYFAGLSLHDAAKAHQVSPRKAQSWSTAEGWAKLKTAAQSAPPSQMAPNVVNFERPRGAEQSRTIEVILDVNLPDVSDLRAVLDRSIARLDAMIQQPYDLRTLAGMVTAQTRAIETRRKIASTEELINDLLERFPNPRDLLAVLKAGPWEPYVNPKHR